MICTILTLNVETREIESAVIKNDNIHPSEVLTQVNKIVNAINEKSKSIVVLSVNVTLIDIMEKQIKNKLNIELKD